jgi:hypothetical protein
LIEGAGLPSLKAKPAPDADEQFGSSSSIFNQLGMVTHVANVVASNRIFAQ